MDSLTLLLDIPRVSEPVRRFDEMVALAQELAKTLRTTMVDDQRVALERRGYRADTRAGRRHRRPHAGRTHHAGQRTSTEIVLLMVSQEATHRATRLRKQIAEYDYWYYVLDAPRVPDAEYDKLFRELQALEAQYPGTADARFAYAARWRQSAG